jgi:hypothetical protein
MKTQCGKYGWIEKHPEFRLWLVYLSPISDKSIGSFDRSKNLFTGCAYNHPFTSADNPNKIVDLIVSQAETANKNL